MDEKEYWWITPFVVYPLLTIYLIWAGVNYWREGDELFAVFMIIVSVFGLLMIWYGAYLKHKEGDEE
jgi:hypothetical protein